MALPAEPVIRQSDGRLAPERRRGIPKGGSKPVGSELAIVIGKRASYVPKGARSITSQVPCCTMITGARV